MPAYELSPIDLDHTDWQGSVHKGRCRAHAPDEDRARTWADSIASADTR